MYKLGEISMVGAKAKWDFGVCNFAFLLPRTYCRWILLLLATRLIGKKGKKKQYNLVSSRRNPCSQKSLLLHINHFKEGVV